MKVAIVTLGCRTNQAESAKLSSTISSFGHQLVDIKENPDVCIINSCSVTGRADSQSRKLVARFSNENKKVIVTGCYAHLNKEQIAESFPGVLVVPNDQKELFSSYLPVLGQGDRQRLSLSSCLPLNRHRPIVKVQDGCDNGCTYCIIPLARGSSRSRSMQEVLDEVIAIEQSGFREIVLSGIHLGMYGKDLTPTEGLGDLIESILKATASVRIRLSSLEILEIDSRLIDLMQDRRICKHLHVPLQSGSDVILARMNRRYFRADFEQCITTLRDRINNIAIGTDIIVGFPGESDADFMQSRELLSRLDLAYLHVFPYSRRQGTPAAVLPGQVPDMIKRERVSELRSLGNAKRCAFASAQVGEVLEILVERRNGARHYGMSANFCKACVVSDKQIPSGSVVAARVTAAIGEEVVAHPINET